MGNYLKWVSSSEAELRKAYKRAGVSEIQITPYYSSTKFWQGKTGWLFGRIPLYLAVEVDGKENEAGLHYIRPELIFSARSANGKLQNKSLALMNLDECLKREGIDKLVFFESLEKLDLSKNGQEEKHAGKTALEGLVTLLKPNDPDKIKKILQEQAATYKKRIEEEKRKIEEEKKKLTKKEVTE